MVYTMRMQRTCLNPRFSLRMQFFLSFGITAVVAISAFVVIGLFTTTGSGRSVRTESGKVLEALIQYSLGRSAQYVAEVIEKKFDHIGGAGSILAEATQDRFMGYTAMEGWKTDDFVPFKDTDTNLNIYPIDAVPLPLDWQIVPNVNEENYELHLPNRSLSWYPAMANVSTQNIAYFMKGACDPDQRDPTHPAYLENCTDANNDILSGGVVSPSDTNYYIAIKAKDLAWAIKPLYEAHLDIKTIGIYFANDGAGSHVEYPGTVWSGQDTFTSIGCEWMNQTHPRTGKPVGTPDQIARCHAVDEIANLREYSAIERGWCRDQVARDIALHNGEATGYLNNLVSTGPYLDAVGGESLWVLTFGQAVFDRLTNEFIACTLLDVSVTQLYSILDEISDISEGSRSALVRWDDEGSVIVASEWDPSLEEEAAVVTDPGLELGVDAAIYNKLRNMVDYSMEWSPEDVRATYLGTILESQGKLIMTHPVPSVPEVYDPKYRPEYLIIISMDEYEAYSVLDEMNVLIEQDVRETNERILFIGCIGFGVILLSITFISSTLTKPMRWMQKVSGMIVVGAGGNLLGQGLIDELDSGDAKPLLCSPRTEVTLLLSEFIKMLDGFSGEGAAEIAGQGVNENKNTFEWREIYEELYSWGDNEIDERVANGGPPGQLSIQKGITDENLNFDDELTEATLHTEKSFFSLLPTTIAQSKYSSIVGSALEATSSVLSSVKLYAVNTGIKAGVMKEPVEEKVEGPPFVNRGENIEHPADEMRDYFEGVEDAHHSYLFWWTLFLVGTPIVVSAILISVAVATDTSENIPKWLADVKVKSIDLELNALISSTLTRARYGEEVMHRFARDLHVLTRATGWLFFGALARANSFTFQATGSGQCKFYTPGDETICPFIENDTLTPCSCEWDDPWGYKCTDFGDTTHPRYLQHRWFEGPASGADAVGDREGTLYPTIDFAPPTTEWWPQDTSELPGAYKGNNATGYETTYDRVRVVSAVAVADFPLYNYQPGIGEQRILGTYVGFEADGMFTGFSGCEHYGNLAHFQSSEGNGAANVRGDLCPLGRYGFDARCRAWYADSKAKLGGHFHITAPYGFASSDVVGMSAAASLIDPSTQQHIGETLIDFSPGSFINALDETNTAIGQGETGFPIVITSSPDLFGTDTLVGPGFLQGDDTAAIGDLVLPDDAKDSPNRIDFEANILGEMRKGSFYYGKFTRTSSDGNQEELYMAYAPVNVKSFASVDHSKFGAGVYSNDTHVYSVGLGITTNGLELPFTRVEEEVETNVNRVRYISIALIIVAVYLVMHLTKTVSLFLSEPIIALVGIVKSIADKTLQDELPKLKGGSCEVYDVYESLEKLCTIVRFSDVASFKGDRAKNYRVAEAALELFMSMNNQKALGVANNNLGTMVLQEQMEKSSTVAKNEEVYYKGINYFDEAIRIGTYEYQNAPKDYTRGDFVKQLANRYFNRGMFYIVNRNRPNAGMDLEDKGVNDLLRAKALDEETYLYWRDRGQLFDNAKNEFFCLLRRARGILTLIQDAGFRDVWGVEDLIEQAGDMLRNPQYTQSTLFEGVNLVSRQQQLTDLQIQYALSKNDTYGAAKLAMKLLVEDEYIIDTVLMNCVTTLNTHFGLHGELNEIPHIAKGVKRETRRGQVDSLREAKNVVLALDYSGSMAGERIQRANENLLWLYEEHCLDKDFIGFLRFNHAVDENLFFDLARKGGNQDEHTKILGQALDAEGGTRLYAALNRCVNMIFESGNSYDSWIIALTDGESSWDFPAKQVIGRIEKHNRKKGPQIHVIIIGFEVSSEVGDSVAQITCLTDKSLYIDARGGLDEMDNAFEQVASVITGTAITMETF